MPERRLTKVESVGLFAAILVPGGLAVVNEYLVPVLDSIRLGVLLLVLAYVGYLAARRLPAMPMPRRTCAAAFLAGLSVLIMASSWTAHGRQQFERRVAAATSDMGPAAADAVNAYGEELFDRVANEALGQASQAPGGRGESPQAAVAVARYLARDRDKHRLEALGDAAALRVQAGLDDERAAVRRRASQPAWPGGARRPGAAGAAGRRGPSGVRPQADARRNDHSRSRRPVAVARRDRWPRTFLCTRPTEKSFDGLHGMVLEVLNQDPQSGDLFLFMNRRKDRVKLLAWEGDGLSIDYKRLEIGTFGLPKRRETRSR